MGGKRRCQLNLVPARTYQQTIDREVLGSPAQVDSIVKLLHQKGLVMINNAGPEVARELIEEAKVNFDTLPNTVPIFDTIRSDGRSTSRLRDRRMSVSPVLPVASHPHIVRGALQSVVTILNGISAHFRHAENIFRNDNTEFALATILSVRESSVQPLHADFSPGEGSSWDDYFRVSKLVKMTPLSFLFFPEGGHLSYIPSNIALSEAHLLTGGKNYARQDAKYGDAADCSFRTAPAVATPIHVEPNTFVLFRQDVAHQGMGYLDSNLRYFVYFDLKQLQRANDTTSPLGLADNRMISIEKMEAVDAFIPPESKRQNIRKQ